jgi:hypothetical protein
MELHLASVAENVGSWSAFFLAWLGILAFFGTLYGVAQTRRDAERAHTLDYLRRFYSHEFAPLSAQVLAFMRTADPDAFSSGAHLAPNHSADGGEIAAAFKALDLETETRVVRVLNFYEELSCSYREGLLDKAVADKMLVPTIESGWEIVKPFIEKQRAEYEERLLDAGFSKDRSNEIANGVMEEWEKLIASRRTPPRSSWVEKLDPLTVIEGSTVRVIGILAATLIAGGLVAVGLAAAAHDVPSTTDSFLVALAATFAILAVVALTPALTRSQSPRRLLLTGAVTGVLAVSFTAGLTIALDLTSSVGPHGPTGKRGPAGGEGEPGQDGKRGARGQTGRQGSRGPRGPEGNRGAIGPRGPRGQPWVGS